MSDHPRFPEPTLLHDDAYRVRVEDGTVYWNGLTWDASDYGRLVEVCVVEGPLDAAEAVVQTYRAMELARAGYGGLPERPQQTEWLGGYLHFHSKPPTGVTFWAARGDYTRALQTGMLLRDLGPDTEHVGEAEVPPLDSGCGWGPVELLTFGGTPCAWEEGYLWIGRTPGSMAAGRLWFASVNLGLPGGFRQRYIRPGCTWRVRGLEHAGEVAFAEIKARAQRGQPQRPRLELLEGGLSLSGERPVREDDAFEPPPDGDHPEPVIEE